MSCFLYSTIEAPLRICGFKCSDMKKLLLQKSQTYETELLRKVLDMIYFTEIPTDNHQRKAVIRTKDILTAQIEVFVLLQGTNNHKFCTQIEKSTNYRDMMSFAHCTFGRIRMTIQSYNKCLCDRCVSRNLSERWGHQSRVIVFKDFFLPINNSSLVQLSIKALQRNIECCSVSEKRRPYSWLADGDNLITSNCRLSYDSDQIKIEKQWDNIEYYCSYLIVDVKEKLQLYSIQGLNIFVTDFPKIIEQYFESGYLLFVTKMISYSIIIIYDQDYSELLRTITIR